MGILRSKATDKAQVPTKRRSIQTDFANLKPLTKGGTVGFTTFRDLADKYDKPRKQRNYSGFKGSPPSSTKRARDGRFDSDGSDASDEDEGATSPTKKGILEVEAEEFKTILSSEDAKKQGELAEGVQKIRVCCLLFHQFCDIVSNYSSSRLSATPSRSSQRHASIF